MRTICPHCRGNYYPPSELLGGIRYQGDSRRSFARGEGCPKCHDSGFQGRTGIYEVLPAAPEFREMIVHDCSLDHIRQWHRSQGGRSLFDEGLRLAEKEITSLDEVMRVAFFE